MRLINAHTLEVIEYLSEDRVPPFVILSHTWEDEECTFQQMQIPVHPDLMSRSGYKKIQSCCKQTLKDGYEWAWIDTCCIDKTSTAELSEAINSMFRWYRKANICYAYMADVHETTQLAHSRWFTRGWTLQELVAPAIVWFYDSSWKYLGSKRELESVLVKITSIDADVLMHGNFEAVSIARRMSWAAKRQTSRIEDQAYCLLGIFDVNMPLLYGEGMKAFTRLQEEIIKTSDDQSLFAWGLPEKCKTMHQYLADTPSPDLGQMHGLFADSPANFTFSDRIHVLADFHTTLPPMVTNNGVRIELQIVHKPGSELHFAVIYCTMQGFFEYYLGFPMLQWNGTWFARYGELVLIAVTDLVKLDSRTPYCQASAILIKTPSAPPRKPVVSNILRLVNVSNEYNHSYRLTHVRCSSHSRYDILRQEVTLIEDKNALHAVFIYDPATTDPTSIFPNLGHPRLKSKAGRTLQVKRNGTAYIITANGVPLQDRYKFFCRPFAVLVGGTIQHPWVKTMLLLNDENPDNDFQELHTASEDFVRSCTTRKHAVSLLQEDRLTKSLLQDQKHYGSHPIMHWSWSCQPRGTVQGPLSPSASARLHVHANIEVVSSNLVERSLALFVELKDTATFTETEKPKWWSYNSKG